MTKRNIKTKSGLQSVKKSINDMDITKDKDSKGAEKTRPN